MNSPKKLGIWNIPESVKDWVGVKSQTQIDREKQIIEVVTITDMPTDAVIEFLDNSKYNYDTIRRGLLAGASLDDDSIFLSIVSSDYGDMKSLADLSLKKTFINYLSDIPYYTGYWLSYPFIWFAYWIKEGVLQAKEEIWD